ncbi:hypothetical protein ACFFHM_21495 [Halalkalibacter kiskunsagensis]|uniref:Uncharacterized protein n=1 Tax=Halalkalibacter kiskunsagensis TaxID=1548599 RepID=A0ABV6KLY3_9BACI
MNKVGIAIVGVIVLAISVYFVPFHEDTIEEATLSTEVLETEEINATNNLEKPKDNYTTELIEKENGSSVMSVEGMNKQVAYQVGAETQVKSIIAEQHEYLNELAGWGNAEELDLLALEKDQEWQQLKDDIDWLQKSGFAESDVLIDMENALEFLTVATTGDSMSLRYLHRIFHDLDANMNGQEVDKIWDVTHAFGTESQQEQLLAYLTSEGN